MEILSTLLNWQPTHTHNPPPQPVYLGISISPFWPPMPIPSASNPKVQEEHGWAEVLYVSSLSAGAVVGSLLLCDEGVPGFSGNCLSSFLPYGNRRQEDWGEVVGGDERIHGTRRKRRVGHLHKYRIHWKLHNYLCTQGWRLRGAKPSIFKNVCFFSAFLDNSWVDSCKLRLRWADSDAIY